MKTKELTVNTEHGLHLRVAAEIVKMIKSHQCSLGVSCDGCQYADGCSIMQLLSLGAARGTQIKVRADGPDEDVVITKVSTILGDGDGI